MVNQDGLIICEKCFKPFGFIMICTDCESAPFPCMSLDDYLKNLKDEENKMKVTSLDSSKNPGQVPLCAIDEYAHFQLPSGDLETVYQRLQYHENHGKYKIRSVKSGSIFYYDPNKIVYGLDCELIVKRRMS